MAESNLKKGIVGVVQIHDIITKLQEAEKLLESERFSTLTVLAYKSHFKALHSQLLNQLITVVRADSILQLSNEAGELLSQQLEMQSNLVLVWQLKVLEWISSVHFVYQRPDLLANDLAILQRAKQNAYFPLKAEKLYNFIDQKFTFLTDSMYGDDPVNPFENMPAISPMLLQNQPQQEVFDFMTG